jgi:proteasome accessory factor B
MANQWYLIGHDCARDAVRTFALARLQDVAETGETFEKPRDFSVAEMFSGSFSAFQSGEVERVVLRLDAFAARLSAERKWHPSQEIKPIKNGGAELQLDVSIAPDFENWILSWGAHAEVLRPASLRERIGAEAKAMAETYED